MKIPVYNRKGELEGYVESVEWTPEMVAGLGQLFILGLIGMVLMYLFHLANSGLNVIAHWLAHWQALAVPYNWVAGYYSGLVTAIKTFFVWPYDFGVNVYYDLSFSEITPYPNVNTIIICLLLALCAVVMVAAMGKLLIKLSRLIGRYRKTALACLFGPGLLALVYWVLHWVVLWLTSSPP